MKDQTDSPWMVTVVQTQLDAMAGTCNELHRAGRDIKFIIPITQASALAGPERLTSHIAIFTLAANTPTEG